MWSVIIMNNVREESDVRLFYDFQPLLSQGDEAARASNPATVPTDVPDTSSASQSPSSPVHQSNRTRTPSASSHVSSIGGHNSNRLGVSNPEDASRPLYKKDALFTGSRQQLHRMSHTSLHKSNPYVASAMNIPAAIAAEEKKDSAFKAFADILVAMTDFSILKNKQMLLICIGNVFSMLGYYLPIMCLVSFAAEDMQVNRTHASFLMTIFGEENTPPNQSGVANLPLQAFSTPLVDSPVDPLP